MDIKVYRFINSCNDSDYFLSKNEKTKLYRYFTGTIISLLWGIKFH